MFGGNGAAVGRIGYVAAAEAFIEIGAHGRAFGYISLVVIEVLAGVDIPDPGIVGAVGCLIALGGGTGLCGEPAVGCCKKDERHVKAFLVDVGHTGTVWSTVH